MAVILVVEDDVFIREDDVFIREIAEMMIQDWGHQTLSASDVDEGLSHLRSLSTLRRFLPISTSRRRSLAGVNLHTRQSSFGRNCVSSTRQAIPLPTK